MQKLIVSFLVPTFNRSKYCISLIKSISNVQGEFEVIISDNSTDKILYNYIENNKIDRRIKYKYTDEQLNMTQNINRAISFANGYYLCCIGDDDTIMPSCVTYLDEFKKKGVDIISPKITINYCWPDFSSRYFKHAHKSRLYYRFSKPYVKRINSIESYKEALNNCFQGTGGMPKLYHGFVKREYFEKIKTLTGDYLFGSSPDISAAVLLLKNSDFYYETNIPLTIPGASLGSNTARAAKKNHFGKLEDEVQTRDFAGSWPELLPRVFTVETVWAHSAILSLNKLNLSSVDFNYIKLNSLILINNSGSFNYTKDHITRLNFQKILLFIYYLLVEFTKKQIIRFQRLLVPTASGGRIFFSNVKDLEDVINKAWKIRVHKNFNQHQSISLIKKLIK